MTNYASIQALNASKLKDAYTEGWAYFAAAHVHKTIPPKDKKEFAFGTAIHLALLKPDEFTEKVITVPRELLDKRGNRTTDAAKEFVKQNPDKVVLSDKEMNDVHQCMQSLLAHDQVLPIMSMPRITETPISATIDGRPWKGIPDIVAERGTFVVDLKSTGFISEKKFRWQVYDLGYHIQAAWYLRLCEEVYQKPYTTFVFIGIETEPPYRCRCYYLGSRAIQRGNDDIELLLSEYDSRMASGDWLEDCDKGLILID